MCIPKSNNNLIQAICSAFSGTKASVHCWAGKECTGFTGRSEFMKNLLWIGHIIHQPFHVISAATTGRRFWGFCWGGISEPAKSYSGHGE